MSLAEGARLELASRGTRRDSRIIGPGHCHLMLSLRLMLAAKVRFERTEPAVTGSLDPESSGFSPVLPLRRLDLAETVGFEPTNRGLARLIASKASPISRSGTSPSLGLVRHVEMRGVEPRAVGSEVRWQRQTIPAWRTFPYCHIGENRYTPNPLTDTEMRAGAAQRNLWKTQFFT